MATQKLIRKRVLTWRVVVTAVLVIVAVYTLSNHWQTVTSSFMALRHANIVLLIVALLLVGLSFCIAALSYQVLALKRLRYRQTLLVEVAGAFVGRLLPAGLGGLGLNGVYLYKRKHTPADATAVISVNNLLGMCAHGLLLGALCVFQTQTVLKLVLHFKIHIAWILVLSGVLVAIMVCLAPIVRVRIWHFGVNLLMSVRKEKPTKLVTALLTASGLTATYTMILFCVSHAIGIDIGALGIFVVFTLGMLVGTATPTPGGLVGAEAGLFAGFVTFGVRDMQAGAAVLLFRLLTYWLPIVPGICALLVAQKHRIL